MCVPWVFPLRREDEKEVPPYPKARCLKAGLKDLLSGAGVGGALQADELTGSQGAGNGVGGLCHILKVGVSMVRQWCGNTDENGIGLSEAGEVGGGFKPTRSNHGGYPI